MSIQPVNLRVRFFAFLALGVAAAFLVVASQSFAAPAIASVTLGVGIGTLIVSLGVAARFPHHVPSLASASLSALISAWMIVASQVFSLGTVQNLTFAGALGVCGLALAGLTAHELGTERVVHTLEMSTVSREALEEPSDEASSLNGRAHQAPGERTFA